MIIEQIMNFLITESPDEAPNDIILFISLLIAVVGLLFVLGTQSSIVSRWRNLEETRSALFPIVAINLALVLRLLVSSIDSAILFFSSGKYELRFLTTYQTIPWFLIFFFSIYLIRNLIKVPKKRQSQINRIQILNGLATFILGLLLIVSIVPIPTDLGGGIASLGLLLVTIVLWIVTILVIRETNTNASKLARMRLQMIGYGDLSISLSFSTTPFIIIVAILGFFGPVTSLIFQFINMVLTCLASISFYWSFFIPNWLKQSYGLGQPTSDLI